MDITVYSKPMCVQCDATHRAFIKAGVQFDVVDLSEEPDALEMVREMGYLQAPVVVANGEHWAGYRPDRIKAVAAAAGSAERSGESVVAVA